jgi:thiol-disulfide isomerase/thioredoxin
VNPLLLALTFCAVLWSGRAEEAQFPVLPLGSPLPMFRLPGADGKTYTPDDFKSSKVMAVVFTCNHCPTAQAYEERIKALAADYKSRGVAVIAVNPNSPAAVRLDEMGYTDVDDTLESMKLRAAQKKFNFVYLDDGPTEEFSKKLGPVATPHVFVFDEKRVLRFQGRIDDSEREELVKVRDTREVLDALLAGREPAVKQTRVFGCSTKWESKSGGNQRWIEKVQKEPVALEAADVNKIKELRANAQNKVRMINVWATWCGPCVSEFDELIETNLRFRHRDFELITVSAQFPDEQDTVLAFLKKHHSSVKNYLFGDTDKYKLLAALDPDWNGAIPYTLVLGPKGEVIHREVGSIDFLELRRKIVPALNKITPWPGMK